MDAGDQVVAREIRKPRNTFFLIFPGACDIFQMLKGKEENRKKEGKIQLLSILKKRRGELLRLVFVNNFYARLYQVAHN